MASFGAVQNLLSHGSNYVKDDEFLILYDLFEPRNPHFPYAKFTVDEMAEHESLSGTFALLQKIWTFQKPNDGTKDQFVVE